MKTRLLLLLASIPLLAQNSLLPYSAVQISETTETLADGTHRTRDGVKVIRYRDTQGRTRTEVVFSAPSIAPRNFQAHRTIEIYDPSAGIHYSLSEFKRIAARMKMPNGSAAFVMPFEAWLPVIAGNWSRRPVTALIHDQEMQIYPSVRLRPSSAENPSQNNSELIGRKIFEGWLCDGTRSTATILPELWVTIGRWR